MVMRDYLPYKSARLYQDRGMAKWMGFFISEHTSALGHFSDAYDIKNPHPMPQEQLWLAIQQAYLHQLRVVVFFRHEGKVAMGQSSWDCLLGTIREVHEGQIGIDSQEGYRILKADVLVAIHLAEEGEG